MKDSGSLQLTEAGDDTKDASRLALACPCKFKSCKKSATSWEEGNYVCHMRPKWKIKSWQIKK